jgi:hypothetical protein
MPEPDGPAAVKYAACASKSTDQNFTITDTTMTSINTVGTSFIMRNWRPVNLFRPTAKS